MDNTLIDNVSVLFCLDNRGGLVFNYVPGSVTGLPVLSRYSSDNKLSVSSRGRRKSILHIRQTLLCQFSDR